MEKPRRIMEFDSDANDYEYPLTAIGVLSFAITKELHGAGPNIGGKSPLEHHLSVLKNNPGNYRW